VADGQAGRAFGHEPGAAVPPRRDLGGARRGDRSRGRGVPGEQRRLDRAVAGAEAPVAALHQQLARRAGQQAPQRRHGVRAERGAEALVGALVAVDQLRDGGVGWVGRVPRDPAVVGQDDVERGVGARPQRRQAGKPRLGHQVEQG
jgi:hypothetical protein